jgi:LPXTG-motif cell wall-anchored protein
MSPGRFLPWRWLSPLAVLLWIIVSVGFAGAAHADKPSVPPASAAGQQSQAAEPDETVGQPDATTTSVQSPAESHSHAQNATHENDSPGDLTSPQPISEADANTGGANGQCPDGPYCSTRDGSASHNGNGGGTATSEPCAGCAGKADNKNPHGQMPDASDANAGYECDTNHGIARGNPAHTACVSGPEQGCVPTETVPCVPSPPECVPTESVPCVPSPPECVPTQTAPCVPGTTVEAPRPPAGQAVVAPSAMASPSARALPNTGAPEELAWLAAAALASITGGVALLTSRRQRVGS